MPLILTRVSNPSSISRSSRRSSVWTLSGSINLNYHGSVVHLTSGCKFQRNIQSSKREDHGTGRRRLNHTLRPPHIYYMTGLVAARSRRSRFCFEVARSSWAFSQWFSVSSCGAQVTCESFLGRRTHIRLQESLRGESVHLRGLRDRPESGRVARFRGQRTQRSNGRD